MTIFASTQPIGISKEEKTRIRLTHAEKVHNKHSARIVV
jgi:hypothetical protein